MLRLIGTLSVALLLLGLFFWFMADRSETENLSATTDEVILEEGAAGPTRRQDPSLRESRPTGPTAEEGDDEGPALRLESQPVEESFLLRCLLRESAEALPGVDVFVIDLLDYQEATGPSPLSLETLMERSGKRYQTDKEGCVFLPQSLKSSYFAARSEAYFGGPLFRPEQGPLEIELEMLPRDYLEVLVVDSLGRPQEGIPVVVRMRHPHYSQVMEIEPKPTSSLGKAHVLLSLPRLHSERTGGLATFSVAIDGLFEKAVEQGFDCQSPPPEGVQLQVPDSARVIVKAKPSAPRPGSKIAVSIVDEERSMTAVFEKDQAFIPVVGLGLELQFQYLPDVSSADKEQVWHEPGPTEDGVDKTVVLDRALVSKRPLILAQCRAENEMDLSEVPVTIYLAIPGSDDAGAEVAQGRLQPDARLRMGLDTKAAESLSASGGYVVVSVDDSVHLVAQFGPLILQPGENDLGELIMSDLPLLVAGRVTDQEGQPIFKALLRLDGGSRVAFNKAHLGRAYLASDREGQFEFRDRLDLETVQLSVQARGYSETKVEVPKGSSNVAVTLKRESRLHVQLDLPPGRKMPSLVLNQKSLSEGGRSMGYIVSEAGLLDRVIEPGLYDFELRPHTGGGRPSKLVLQRWAGVEILPGETKDLGTVLVDIAGIDVEVFVDLPETLSLASLHYDVLNMKDTKPIASGYVGNDSEKVIHFTVDALPVKLRVHAHHGGSAEKIIESSQDRISLGPGLKLRFQLKDPVSLPEGSQLHLRFYNRQGQGDSGMISVGRGDSLDLVAPAPGHYSLSLSLDQLTLQPLGRESNPFVSPFEFDLKDQEAIQTINLEFQPGSIEAARAADAERRKK